MHSLPTRVFTVSPQRVTKPYPHALSSHVHTLRVCPAQHVAHWKLKAPALASSAGFPSVRPCSRYCPTAWPHFHKLVPSPLCNTGTWPHSAAFSHACTRRTHDG